jgi:hypothetical protein
MRGSSHLIDKQLLYTFSFLFFFFFEKNNNYEPFCKNIDLLFTNISLTYIYINSFIIVIINSSIIVICFLLGYIKIIECSLIYTSHHELDG